MITQFLWFGISRWLCTWTYTWINRRKSIRSRKRFRDVGGDWILWRFRIDLESDPQTAVEGRWVELTSFTVKRFVNYWLFCGNCSRASQHIRHLLEYISQFPRVNPSSSDEDAASSHDILKLLSQIRSRYKALCSILGVHPRLRSSNEASHDGDPGNSDVQLENASKDSAIPLWRLDRTGAKKPVTNQDLSFWNQLTDSYVIYSRLVRELSNTLLSNLLLRMKRIF